MEQDYFFTETPIKQVHLIGEISNKLDSKIKPHCLDQICFLENVCIDTQCVALFDGNGKAGQSITLDLKQIFSQYIMMHSTKIAWLNKQYQFEQFMHQMFDHIQDKLRNNVINYDESGASAIIILIKKNQLFLANIGNSKAILYQEKVNNNQSIQKNAIVITEEHIPINPIEKDRILDKGGKIYKQFDQFGKQFGPYKIWEDNYSLQPGLPVTRQFGNYIADKIGLIHKPNHSHLLLQKEDKFIVLGSDGLMNIFKPAEICGFIQQYMENKEIDIKDNIGDYILSFCEERIKSKKVDDNLYGFKLKSNLEDISVIIIFFNFEDKPLPFVKKSEYFHQSFNNKSKLKSNINPNLCAETINFKKSLNSTMEPEIVQFRSKLKKLKGTPNLVILGGITCFGIGLLSVPVWAQTLVRLTNLEKAQIDLLNNLPLVSGTFGRLILGKAIAKDGGKNFAIYLSLASIFGVILIFFVQLSVNLEELDSSSISYYILISAGFLVGSAVSNFQLLANAVFWSPTEKSGHVQAVQAGFGNSFLGIIATIIYQVILLIITILYYQNPPNKQLEKMKLTENDSKIISEYLGQKNFATECEFLKSLKDLNSLIFVLNYFYCFGGFLTMNGFIKNLVINYHHQTPYVGLMQNFIFVTLVSLTRVFSGKITDKYGGYLITQIGLLFTLFGSTLGIFTPPDTPYGFIHITAMLFNFLGLGSQLAANYKWILEVEYGQYTCISSLAGTFGAGANLFFNIAMVTPIKNSGEGNIIYGYSIFIGFSFIILIINLLFQKVRLRL